MMNRKREIARMLKDLTVKLGGMAFLLCLTSSIYALSIMPVNLGQLVQITDKAFEGEAISTKKIKIGNEWADQITMKVLDPILGAVAEGEEITWNQMRSGDDFALAGMPTYVPGQTYVIFLPDTAPGSQFQAPVALGQGAFLVHVNKQTGEKVALNEFRNSTLFQNIDTQGLSMAIASESTSGTRSSVTPTQTAEIQSKLSNGPAGAIDLQTLKNAARAFKAQATPAQAFQSKGSTEPLKLQINKSVQ